MRAHGLTLLHGWPRSDLLALAGIVVAVALAAISPLRQWAVRGWRLTLMRAGLTRRKYARWFVRTWGIYENPYLDDKQNLDLSNTYVPLSFRSPRDEGETLTIATAILADTTAGNLIIDGAPGSGKSTLMKAYGVGVLQRGGLLQRRGHIVPFLIPLRRLARENGTQISVADYLIKILRSGAGMSSGEAARFLRYSLGRGQVLVMLDGLDEVTADRYQAVHEAVREFVTDHRPDCPTDQARVIVTCRRQNFLSLREEWIPAIAGTMCSLAPLRNSEIFSYLDKLRPKFKAAGGPESFMQAVRASGTLDLHRIPLILAMSVGLYARKDYFEIPSSIAELYQKMVSEMLDRHRFKGDPVGAAVVFQLRDKYRFLREFALHAAVASGGFDEFSMTDLANFADGLARHLNAVTDPRAFVAEVIDRSGLLSDVGEGGRYVFAHRSIQEFLAAEELRIAAAGPGSLLAAADDPEWRQAIQFYVAGLEQRQANDFLPELSRRNAELAGFCLAGAQASDDVAAGVLGALKAPDGVQLAALAAATMSPRLSVQQMAIAELRQALSGPHASLAAIGGDVDGMLPLLGALSGTNAAEIAALVPQVIEHVPDDPRLVEPLWRCLTAQGIEGLPAAGAIVARLLSLIASADGFEELTRQESYTRPFLTAEVRHAAYPFSDALRHDHNLVTLLAWAHRLDVTPPRPNRYFEAKAAGRLDRVEVDRRRTMVFEPFQFVSVSSMVIMVAAVVGTIAILVSDPRDLLRPFGWWTLAVIAAAILIPFGIALAVSEIRWPSKKLNEILGLDAKNVDTAEPIIRFMRKSSDSVRGVVIISSTIAIAIAPCPLMAISLPAYSLLTLVGCLFFWGSSFDGVSRGKRYYLYRPSPYIDIYEDPRCRHWLTRA